MNSVPARRILTLLPVPVLAFGGIVIAIILVGSGLLPVNDIGVVDDPGLIPLNPGVWGNVLASFLIGGMAYRKKKKDLVSLLVPVYAVIILVLNPEIRNLFILQVLYAITVSALVIRLEWRYT